MNRMQRFRCHKIVEAGKIVRPPGLIIGGTIVVKGIDGELIVDLPEEFGARGWPSIGDYLVRYDDGYLSWSPAKAFEDGYELLKIEKLIEMEGMLKE